MASPFVSLYYVEIIHIKIIIISMTRSTVQTKGSRAYGLLIENGWSPLLRAFLPKTKRRRIIILLSSDRFSETNSHAK